MSKTGSCKTFDNEADGYCRSDGIGSVIVKRLSDAERDRDNILAVVLGAATNHSANAVSITHPHAGAQSNLFRKVVQQSGIDATDVNYVEMHGTGTQAGDGTEMRSVLDVFAPSHPARAPNNPLYVGAVKVSKAGFAYTKNLFLTLLPGKYRTRRSGNYSTRPNAHDNPHANMA